MGPGPEGAAEAEVPDAMEEEEVFDDEWADSNHDFRMDGGLGGLPKEFVGSLHVMFPHQVWHVPARYELSFDAPTEATVNVALWFNNDSSYYVRNGWDPHDAAYCNTEMPISSATRNIKHRLQAH